MAKHVVTGEQYYSIDGQMLEIKRQLRLKSGSPLDPELVSWVLQDIIEGKFNQMRDNTSSSFRRISGSEELKIEALDGKAYISDAKKVFSDIDLEFNFWGLNRSGLATNETFFDVIEMEKEGTGAEIFASITTDLDKLVMTQHQIIRFCEKYFNWLGKRGHGTLFLIKENEEYFNVIVTVDAYPNILGVYLLKANHAYSTVCRLVVPSFMASV